MASLLSLPPELLYDIVEEVASSWNWDALRWLLELRFTNRKFDDLIMRRLLAAIYANDVDLVTRLRFCGEMNALLATVTKLLSILIYDSQREFSCRSPYALVNMVCQAVDNAVAFFGGLGTTGDGQESPEELKMIYTDGMVAALVGVKQASAIIDALTGENGRQELDGEEGWRGATLMTAAYLGRLGDMEALLQAGDLEINADSEDKWVCPPLMAAAYGGKVDVIRYLAGRGVNMKTQTKDGTTALHYASCKGEVDAVRLLLENGADAEMKDNTMDTPLAWACITGHTDVAKVLLESTDVIANTTDANITAVAAGEDEDVEENNEEGKLLAGAAIRGNEDMFQLLFSHFSIGKEGMCQLLDTAIGGKKMSIVQTIIDADPSILGLFSKFWSNTALLEAVHCGSEEIVRYLLSLDGTSINHANLCGETALHLAVRYGRADKVRILLEHPDIDVNARGGRINDYATPLAVAVCRNDVQLVNILLAHDDVERDPIDRNGNTPLLIAAWMGSLPLLEAFLDQPRVNVRHRNYKGKTALSLAVQEGHAEVVERLLNANVRASIHALIDSTIALISGEPENLCSNGDEWVTRPKSPGDETTRRTNEAKVLLSNASKGLQLVLGTSSKAGYHLQSWL